MQAEKLDRLAEALARPSADSAESPPRNYLFWIGSGFSATAGIPLAEGVVDRLLDLRWSNSHRSGRSRENFCNLTIQAQAERRTRVREWAVQQRFFSSATTEWAECYGECLKMLPGEIDRQEFIVRCIEEGRGRLNMAHLLLGQLIKTRYVDTVLTTNFDDLLLRSLQLYFVVPSAIDPESARTLLTNSRFVQVAYLHGRLASYRQRHTPTEVSDSIEGFENYLAQALQDHGLVVVGYRGGDETPMHILHKVLMERGTGPGRGLFWVSRSDDPKTLTSKVTDILNLKDCYWLPGWDADDFMKRLCAWPGIGLSIPNPTEWMTGMQEMLPAEATEFLTNKPSVHKVSDVTMFKAPHHGAKSAEGGSGWKKRIRKLLEERKPEEALDVLEQAKPESEETVTGWQFRVRILQDLDRKEDAIAAATTCVGLFPEDPAAHNLLARISFQYDNYDEAIRALRRALELDSNNPQAKQLLGVVLNCTGQKEEAAQILELSLEDKRDNRDRADSLFWLALSLSELGRHERAIQYFQQASELVPQDTGVLHFYAHSLEALGRHAEAAAVKAKYEALEKAEKQHNPK